MAQRSLSLEYVPLAAPSRVIDCWRVLNHLDGVDGIRYVRLGYGGEAERPVGVSLGAR